MDRGILPAHNISVCCNPQMSQKPVRHPRSSAIFVPLLCGYKLLPYIILPAFFTCSLYFQRILPKYYLSRSFLSSKHSFLLPIVTVFVRSLYSFRRSSSLPQPAAIFLMRPVRIPPEGFVIQDELSYMTRKHPCSPAQVFPSYPFITVTLI